MRNDTSRFFQTLESRQLLAVSQDSGGWTVVKPSSGSRIIYVSSSGKDSNNGLSPSSPIKSLFKAQGMVRSGSPDHILLKRGDTFYGTFGEWRKKGKSAQEPMLIGAYGSGARPKIRTGTGFGIITYSRAGQSIDNLVIQSLDFFPEKYNHFNGNISTGGIRLLCKGTNVLIEDVKVAGYRENITLGANDSTISNGRVRRSQILDAHAASSVGNAQGLYISGKANGIVIEENIIDHNGWRTNNERTFFNHNVYVYNGAKNVTIRNNIISRGGFYGLKFNAGGTATNNFFARNSESIYMEGSSTITSNVITEAITMPTKAWGVGINTQKAPSATIRGNLITKIATTSSVGTAGILLYNGGSFSGTVEDNVINNWRNGLKVSTPGKGSSSVRILDNKINASNDTAAAEHWSRSSKSTFVYSGNDYYSTKSNVNKYVGALVNLSGWKSRTGESNAEYKKSSFSDPNRDIARYASGVGGGNSFESFIAIARNMDRNSWKSSFSAGAVNNWFRAGFNMGSSASLSVSVVASSPFSKTNVTSEPSTDSVLL